MRENVGLRPTRNIKRGAVRKEIETSLRQRHPAFTDEPDIELFLELVKKAHILGVSHH